jgi:hypothetical protein
MEGVMQFAVIGGAATGLILLIVYAGKLLNILIERAFPAVTMLIFKKPMFLSKELKDKYMAKYKEKKNLES